MNDFLNDGVTTLEAPIPQEYGRTYIVLLPRDPTWMFSYWEVQSQSLNVFRKQFGAQVIDSARVVLRIFELAPHSGNGTQELFRFELSISLESRCWYINVQEPGRTWFVELGLITQDGRFILLARSNTAALPLGQVSDVTDSRWVSIREGFDKLVELSGIERIGQGSLEIAKMLSHRWEMLGHISSWPSSISASRSAPPTGAPFRKGFWLSVGCEVIIYGATEPNARVKVAGKDVAVNPDGTFTLRMALPDGALSLPVEAVSENGHDVRHVHTEVSRQTPLQET